MLLPSTMAVSLFHSGYQFSSHGGLLMKNDPTTFDTADPLRLWIIQVGIIILTTQALSLVLRKIHQPRVIAEVLGGIILGPTGFGRIPNFTQHVFPPESRPYLGLVANIGLCFFLFLVGLEIDASLMKRNAKLSISVALAGMLLPFGLGALISMPIYHHFVDHNVVFPYFVLFTGVAFSITAFPVLCRILTELQLLDTTVGIVVLSAGVGNDVIGWALLALSVALVNAGSGLTALWILLVCVGWTLFLLFPVKRIFRWFSRRTGSIENEPSMLFLTVTMLLLFGSAFFTDAIGVHAIFGAFLAGIIVPREGGLAIALTEKLEDMVSIIFLPLYFTLSGLSTDLGLLDNGITWAYTVAICVLAFIGKFGGCSLAARYSGFNWREAGAIGSLMSCKGLVELIVLNVGLSAGILSQRVFSMFVLEALLLTFLTTPLVTVLYPMQHRVRASGTGANFLNVADEDRSAAEKARTSRSSNLSSSSSNSSDMSRSPWKTHFTIVLDKLEHLPGMMAFTKSLISQPLSDGTDAVTNSAKKRHPPFFVDALRLIDLTDNFSAVMKSSASEAVLLSDPLLRIFCAFGELNDLPVSSSLSIIPNDQFAPSVVIHARDTDSDLIVIPCSPLSHANLSPDVNDTSPKAPLRSHNPFDALFRSTITVGKPIPVNHSHFIRDIFSHSTVDVALFIDPWHGGPASGKKQHIYFPFFGGPDDRLALHFVAQLCQSPRISATVVRVEKRPLVEVTRPETARCVFSDGTPQHTSVTSESIFPYTVGAHLATTHTRLQSETADNLAWKLYADLSVGASDSAIERMEMLYLPSPTPLHAVTRAVTVEFENLAEKKQSLWLVTGRSRRFAPVNHNLELQQLVNEHGLIHSEISRTVGDVAAAFMATNCKATIVVLQAGKIADSG